MGKPWIFSIFLFWSLGCTRTTEPDEHAGKHEAPLIQESDALEVSTIISELRTFSLPIQSKGIVQSVNRVELSFPISGKLEALPVKNTKSVREGQLLASLENERLKINVEDALVAFRSAQSEFENELGRMGDSTVFGDNWPRIKEKAMLKTRVEATEIALRKAQHELSQTYLYAPFNGVLEGLFTKKGNYISALETLATLLDLNDLEVETDILEFDIGALKVGDKGTIIPLSTGNAIDAVVKEINPRVDESGYIKVKLKIPGTSSLYNGMTVKVTLNVPQSQGILVPKLAVVQKSGRTVVFTAENNLAKWNYVTLGKDNGDFVEILEGIEVGERVIVSNNLQLAHDSPIQLDQNL